MDLHFHYFPIPTCRPRSLIHCGIETSLSYLIYRPVCIIRLSLIIAPFVSAAVALCTSLAALNIALTSPRSPAWYRLTRALTPAA